jgi:hypothetical protein
MGLRRNRGGLLKNRERLLNQEVARAFFARVLAQAKPHLSDEHFTVDGTLIEAWANQKRFQKASPGPDQGQTRDRPKSLRPESQACGDAVTLGHDSPLLAASRGFVLPALCTETVTIESRHFARTCGTRHWPIVIR